MVVVVIIVVVVVVVVVAVIIQNINVSSCLLVSCRQHVEDVVLLLGNDLETTSTAG
jgi:hypothetical protein